MINTSDSLPNWAFFVHKNKNPVRGDLVFFRPPHSPLLTRHFGESVKPFGKYVYGMPGDVVSHDGNRVLVNGRVVASMKPTTRTGETLHHGPIGRIPARCYYVGTPHPDGFDSRYAEIGFVCRDRILGTGVSIL
jgi:conjugal transfer pilin signal peptidase TrbI